MFFCCINQHLNKPGNILCIKCGSLLAGAIINDYRVVSYIGKGSTSDVYLAEQNSLHGRKVVIKILHRSCSEEHVDNFRSEAKLLASLTHPYILPIFSYGVIHERTSFSANFVPYLVVQFVEQGSLAESFEREGNRPWSLERVVTLAREVAEALDYAHSRNVLHRDVKPANLLQIGSHVLLSDFSVASLIDADASHLSTGLAGSPAYMAPEVWGMHPGRYSDQYAFAIACYFLLTGNYPLRKDESSNMRAWQYLHCYVTPTSIGEYRADLPLAINLVLQKAMAKNPHERYPTVEAFAIDLLKASQEITQQLVKSPVSVLSPVPQFRSVPGNVQANEKELLEWQHVGVSLANAPATDPIAPTIITAPKKIATMDNAGKGKLLLHEVHATTAKTSVRNNRWIWCALLLNLFIYLMLSTENALITASFSLRAEPLLVLLPILLIGPLLGLLFKRIPMSTLAWSLFWGLFFGMTNALLSLGACMICGELVHAMQSPGSTGAGLSSYFGPSLLLAVNSHIVILLLLALWVSVIGGAIIAIFSMQGEGVVRISHQAPRKQNSK